MMAPLLHYLGDMLAFRRLDRTYTCASVVPVDDQARIAVFSDCTAGTTGVQMASRVRGGGTHGYYRTTSRTLL